MSRSTPDPASNAPRRPRLCTACLPLVLVLAWGCDVTPGETSERAEAAEVGALPDPTPEPRPEPLDEVQREPTRGLNPEMLEAAVENAAGLDRLYTMIVARHGEIVLERHFRGPGLDDATNVKSASKSMLSAIAGLAIADRFIEGLDQPVTPYFSEYLPEDADPGKREITVRDLLAMRSGLETTSNRNYGTWVSSSNWVRHAITRPLEAEPGSRMIYSTGNSHLMSAVITEATGRSTLAYAREALAEPLGIRLPPWPTDPQGIYFGGNDMLISARNLFRFGEMYRNGGTLDGARILPREWIEESWRVRLRESRRRGNDYYGLGWWGRDTNGYAVRFAWGYGGQFLFIVPALELTVVFTSDPWSEREGPHNRRLHDLLDDLIVPAAMTGAGISAPDPSTTAGVPGGSGAPAPAPADAR